MGAAVLTPRFAKDEGHKVKPDGSLMRAVRCLDDFSASWVNSAAWASECMRLNTLDTLVSLARLAAHGARYPRLRLTKADFTGAFKTLPIHSADLDVAVSVWRRQDGTIRCLQLFALPFGALPSGYCWERLGHAIQSILAVIFHIPRGRYVDDVFGIEAELDNARGCYVGPQNTAQLAKWVIEHLLGWQLDAAKDCFAERQTLVLGITVKYCDDTQTLRFTVPDAKIEKWLQQISRILECGWLSPCDAKQLLGRLAWGSSQVFDRSARVYLAPLRWHSCGSGSWVTSRLRRSLEWWARFLQCNPTRVMPVHWAPRPRIIISSDATGHGDLTYVIAAGDRRFYAAASAPASLRKWLNYRRTQIAAYELVAALAGLCEVIRVFPGAEILLFVDNTAALGVLNRGCSRESDYNELVTGAHCAQIAAANIHCCAARNLAGSCTASCYALVLVCSKRPESCRCPDEGLAKTSPNGCPP